MIIPDKVKVGAMTYTVEQSDIALFNDKGTEICGRINFHTQLIRINHSARFSEQSVELTFFHELFHAFTNERGLDWGDKDELYTEELAKALHAFCVDNNFGFIPQESNV